MERSILWQESIQRAAAWASIQPEHQRVAERVPLRGHEPAGDQAQGQRGRAAPCGSMPKFASQLLHIRVSNFLTEWTNLCTPSSHHKATWAFSKITYDTLQRCVQGFTIFPTTRWMFLSKKIKSVCVAVRQQPRSLHCHSPHPQERFKGLCGPGAHRCWGY